MFAGCTATAPVEEPRVGGVNRQRQDLGPLPTDWAVQRSTMQRLAAHVLGQARHRHDGLFDLVPTPGGFGTPAVGPHRERVRLDGGRLFVERVVGDDLGALDATTTVVDIDRSTIASLCATAGFRPSPDFRVGADTPPLGDPDEPLALDGAAVELLGTWYLLGQRAIDGVVATTPSAAATVGRLWPEHFDFGIDLAARPDLRVNLGAAAGDAFHDGPYLYVGPWSADRPGDPTYWNAPFGAVLGYADVRSADDPVEFAERFLRRGVDRLANG